MERNRSAGVIEPAQAISRENAFPTGSQVYGEPTEASDADLVVLLRPECIRLLEKLSETRGTSGFTDDASIMFGKLNIIAFTDPVKFLAWKQATAHLELLSPVTRQQAIDTIDRCEREMKNNRSLEESYAT